MYPKLSKKELSSLKQWKYSVVNLGITNILLNPFWNLVVKFLPLSLAPNVLTLCGLITGLGIWLVSELFYSIELVPIIILCYCVISTLDGIDGKQARKINNSTPFGELFDHSVDIITLFVVTRISTIVFGISNQLLMPVYIVTGGVFCWAHYYAYLDGHLTMGRFTGPNEVLSLIIIGYLTNSWINWGHMLASNIFYTFCFLVCVAMPFYLCYCINESEISIISDLDKNYSINVNVARTSFIFMAALLINTFLWNISYIQLICMFIMVNAELIVTKMAQTNFRYELHLLCMGCLLNQWLALIIMAYDVFTIFKQIKEYLGIPFLKVFVN